MLGLVLAKRTALRSPPLAKTALDQVCEAKCTTVFGAEGGLLLLALPTPHTLPKLSPEKSDERPRPPFGN